MTQERCDLPRAESQQEPLYGIQKLAQMLHCSTGLVVEVMADRSLSHAELVETLKERAATASFDEVRPERVPRPSTPALGEPVSDPSLPLIRGLGLLGYQVGYLGRKIVDVIVAGWVAGGQDRGRLPD